MGEQGTNRAGQRNIFWYMVFSALRGASTAFSIVLWVIFLQQVHGFNLTQVTMLDIPFWLGRFLFEIPTGIVADRYGRRFSMAVSSVLCGIIWLVFAVTNSFALFAVAQFFGALAATFSTGADESLLFESLQGLSRKNEYAKISGRAKAVETVTAMVSGVLIGLIASVNMILPLILSAGLCFATLLPILSMQETVHAQGQNNAAGTIRTVRDEFASYLNIIRKAWQNLFAQRVLLWSALYMVVLGAVSFYASTFIQPYAVSLGVTVAAMGPVMVSLQLMSIAGSLSIHRAQKLFGNRVILFGVPLLLIPCMAAIALIRMIPVLAVVALSSFLFALTQPVVMAIIQEKVADETRATFLSIQSVLSMGFLILTEPIMGFLSDLQGVHFSYLIMAALMVVFVVPLFLRGRRWLAVRRPDNLVSSKPDAHAGSWRSQL